MKIGGYHFNFDDIIAAQASPRGNSRRGIIRISGNGSLKAVSRFACFTDSLFDQCDPFIADAQFYLQEWAISFPITVWYWPKEHGYTGQESLEIHFSASPPLIDKVLHSFFSSNEIRMANPGEFTLRAFCNGRLDLTQAEAVLGIIDASNEIGLEIALSQLAGNLGTPLRKLKQTFLEMLAHLEAGFDFADENITFISSKDILTRLEEGSELINSKLNQINERADYRRQRRIILTGPPNAGKSSLFNHLCSQNRTNGSKYEDAIVSDIAGTTRDYLMREVAFKNGTAIIVDTAGIDSKDQMVFDLSRFQKPERNQLEEGLRRITKQAFDTADLFFYCLEAVSFLKLNLQLPPPRFNWFIILTKVDQLPKRSLKSLPVRNDVFAISSLTGVGLEHLTSETDRYLFEHERQLEAVPSTAIRCRRSLEACREALSRAYDLTVKTADEVLIAYELRTALTEIGTILGEIQTDEILDSIFSRFCIGK